MAGQDICRQLYDNAPTWLATLNTVTDEAAKRRKSSIVDHLATPELSTHLTTTVGSISETGTVPGHARRAEVSSQIASQIADRRISLQHVEVSRSRGSSLSSKVRAVVFYDASAQEMLAGTVKGIDRLIYNIKRSGQRKALEGVLRSLSKASNTCEDAAFQMLKSGNCKREAQHASAIIQHLYEIARREVMEERLSERLNRRDSAIVQDPADKGGNSRSNSVNAHVASVKRTSVPIMPNLLVDEVDMANDDGKMDISLPNARLTSRAAR